MQNKTDTTTTTPPENPSRRRTLKALGTLGVVSVAGSGTALGAQLDVLVAAGRLATVQATQLFTQADKLTASDGAANDIFGFAMSVSGDGSTALVGAFRDDGAGGDSGSAYVYDLSQDPPNETKLTASDAAAFDSFGWSVSVSGDGTTALVGATGDDDAGSFSGSAYVFVLEALEVFSEPIVLKSGKIVDPQDLDGDGLYEDLDGDGDVDGQDVSRLTQLENAHRKGEIQLTDAQVAALDFNGDGKFTKKDMAAYNSGRTGRTPVGAGDL